MTSEDIIRMAREANIKQAIETPHLLMVHELERFAALVAAAEREACAKVCEGLGVHPALNVFNGGPEWYKHGKDCAAAIRARGQT
jgi:hypothetical protein